MSTQPTTPNRPIPGVLFGITHETTGELIIREPKILKVGIGLPKGPAIDVWIAPDKRWKVRLGAGPDAKTATFAARADAEAKFFEALPKAPSVNYPRKIGYFTFSHPTIIDGREQFVPDFGAIEAHGPTPTEIDIILLDDNPFAGAAYQMWSSSELLCKGDGMNAMRVIKLATDAELDLARAYADAGERTFPIDNCWTGTCPYSKETMKNGKPQPSACKPGGDLKFQVANNIRVGGTAYFHTTGYRSISSIFSSLYRIRTLTGGRLSGIPLKMVLRPFKTNHNGQPATQYAVALEFRAPDVATLRHKLLEAVFSVHEAAGIAPRGLVAPAARMIDAPAEPTEEVDDDEMPISAEAMTAEFYPDEAEEETNTDAAITAPTAATATQEKTAGLADKLKASAGRTRGTAPVAAPDPAPPVPTPAASEPPTRRASHSNTSDDIF